MKQLLKNISPFNNRTDMPGVQYIAKKTLAFWFCYIAGLFLAEFLVILLHFALGKNMLVGDVFDAQTITLIIYYGYIILIAVTLLYWKLAEKKPLSAMGLTKQFGSYFIGIGAGILLLAVCVIAILLTGTIKFHGIFENADIPRILLFVGGFMIQGAMEEILCRGFLLHSLKEKVSLPVAVAVSTVMFVLPHWSSLFAEEMIFGVIGIVNICLISLIFCLLTIRYKSIWAACGLHSFWNAILYSVLGLNLSGNDETSTAIFNMQSVGKNICNGGAFGIEASIVTTAVLTLAVALIGMMGRKGANYVYQKES